jgi:hypothetical protein
MRSVRMPAFLVVVLCLTGCGGGAHSVDLTAPGPTATAGSDIGMASTNPLPSDLPVVGAPTAGPTSSGATSAGSGATGSSSAGPSSGAASSGISLPPLGDATYRLTGQSTVGTLPPRLRFGVADAGSGAQTWTFDASNPDGSGLIEVLTVQPGPDGIYLTGYELKYGGLGHVDLHLTPSGPAPLVPNWPHGGWEFDMPSANGCANAHTVGSVQPPDNDGARHVNLATTVTPTGKQGCPQFTATRAQQLWLPTAGGRLNRVDTQLDASFGTLGGNVSYTAKPTTQA